MDPKAMLARDLKKAKQLSDIAAYREQKQKKLDAMNTPGYRPEVPEAQKLLARAGDKEYRDASLFPTLLWTSLNLICAGGRKEIREDILRPLRIEANLIFKTRPELERIKVLAGIEKDAQAIIRAMDCPFPEQTALGIGVMIENFVLANSYYDPTAGSVLVSMAILTEAREDPEAGWGFQHENITTWAERAYRHAQFLGYL